MNKVLTFIRQEHWYERLFRQKKFWFIFWVFSIAVPVYRSINRELPPPLPVYYQLPEYALTNEFKRPFGSKELRGKFYIANFMFTTCATSCPQLMQKMDIVQNRIKGVGTRAAIVTFTVDPAYDTPEVLYKYARKRNTNPAVWTFLTGNKNELKKIVIDGFKVPMGDKEKVEKLLGDRPVDLFDIAHTEKVVLVDDRGRIRGYYSTDKSELDRLMIDIGLLINNTFAREK